MEGFVKKDRKMYCVNINQSAEKRVRIETQLISRTRGGGISKR